MSARTMRALERAAMRWYRWMDETERLRIWMVDARNSKEQTYLLLKACARHAAARKKERK